MTTTPARLIRQLIAFTHRTLALAGVAAASGLAASFAPNPTVRLLGVVALCAAVPVVLILNTIASRLAQLEQTPARAHRQTSIIQAGRHVA